MTNTKAQSLVVDIDYMQADACPLDLGKYMVVGGAESKPNVSYGDLYSKQPDRLRPIRYPLLELFKDELDTSAARGDSIATLKNKVYAIRGFYVWGDRHNCTLTLDTVRQDCIAYLRNLHDRAYVHRTLSKSSAYAIAGMLASMLKGIARTQALLRAAGFHGQPVGKRLGPQADKQNLADAFRFIDLLRHFSEHLTYEALTGALPLQMPLPDGNSINLSGAPLRGIAQRMTSRRETGAPHHPPVDHRTAIRMRSGLLNLAIEINLLYFIANTGMNLGQALSLRMESARYQSDADDHKILKVYKNRRGGGAEFEIPRTYRGQFEDLLGLRQSLFADADNAPELFLFVHRRDHTRQIGRSKPSGPNFTLTRRLCKLLDIPFVSPQRLRRTRINWLLRRSQDPNLTADMAQHTREMLLDTYADPSYQHTAVEISRFHLATEATLASAMPGQCGKATPTVRQDTPEYAPKPDCVSPAGCLFCTHYCGVDTADYVSSLISYRHLKSLELCRAVPSARNVTTQSPAHAVVTRLTEIIDYLRNSNAIRAAWVAEGNAKVAEGDYHLDWAGFINVLEARA